MCHCSSCAEALGLLYDVANTLQNVFASVVQGLTLLIVGSEAQLCDMFLQPYANTRQPYANTRQQAKGFSTAQIVEACHDCTLSVTYSGTSVLICGTSVLVW